MADGDIRDPDADRDTAIDPDDVEVAINPGESIPMKNRPPPLDVASAQNISPTMATPNSATPRTPRPQTRAEKERKLGHRRVGEGGQVTYKKIETSQIMGAIQLGIGHAIGGLASKPERDLLMQDFAVVETTFFPGSGSNQTPAHHCGDFRFKTYAPVAFRYFRDLFGIQPDDFLLSMCNDPLRELSNPGASGSIFYLTDDDEFIIKTVQHKEGEFLQKLLPGYYMNLNQNSRTLLPKFFGLYCYQCGGKNIRMCIMNNLLPSSVKMHEKYDLKGSTYKRKAAKHERMKESPTYKDLDFMERHPDGLLLEADTYAALIKTIQRDCRVLESFKIMDYSLLVGIHNLDLAAKEKQERLQSQSNNINRADFGPLSGDFCSSGAVSLDAEGLPPEGVSGNKTGLTRSRSINRQKLVAHSTALEAIQAESDPIDEEEDVPIGGLPARNGRGERLLLFLGIIDILQSYRLKKKLEHTWKAMLHDGDTISVHRPGFYAQRFLDFSAKTVFRKIPSPLKHSPSRKKSVSRHRPLSGGDDGNNRSDDANLQSAACSPPRHMSSPPAGAVPTAIAGILAASRSATFTPSNSNILPSAVAASGGIPNLPAVLQGRQAVTKPRVPPPVPPRSPRRQTSLATYPSRISDFPSSTPPPSFEEATQSRQSTTDSESQNDTSDGPKPATIPRSAASSNGKDSVAGMSRVTALSAQSMISESSGSTTSSGFGSSNVARLCTWTPPHSYEGSTPTHTEGTPSFTESSSSGDLGWPSTPVQGNSSGASPQLHGSVVRSQKIVTSSRSSQDSCSRDPPPETVGRDDPPSVLYTDAVIHHPVQNEP